MPTVEYFSTDASAPVLSGTTGSLVALLDAILVNGYGAKSALGWAKSYSGTSKAAYRPASGARLYLRVQDDGPGAGSFREARIRGFETMSDVDTGTGAFPAVAQLTNGLFVRKSATADSTARVWYAIGDEAGMMLFVQSGDVANVFVGFGFGDVLSNMTGDAYRTLIWGRNTENSTSVLAAVEGTIASSVAVNTTVIGHYMPRLYTGIGTSIQVGRHWDTVKGAATPFTGSLAYPNGPDTSIYTCPMFITEAASVAVRGQVRGLRAWGHTSATGVNNYDTFNGAGADAGKTFRILKGFSAATSCLVVETSTWASSS
jgi:hypothetical protein